MGCEVAQEAHSCLEVRGHMDLADRAALEAEEPSPVRLAHYQPLYPETDSQARVLSRVEAAEMSLHADLVVHLLSLRVHV